MNVRVEFELDVGLESTKSKFFEIGDTKVSVIRVGSYGNSETTCFNPNVPIRASRRKRGRGIRASRMHFALPLQVVDWEEREAGQSGTIQALYCTVETTSDDEHDNENKNTVETTGNGDDEHANENQWLAGLLRITKMATLFSCRRMRHLKVIDTMHAK
jgi:hypothetical protein